MTTDSGEGTRFPIAFDSWYRWLSTACGLPPSSAYVQITGEGVEVRMGWAFRARFQRSAVVSAGAMDIRPISRGVHGLGGSWLVNGAGRGILSIELSPAQRAHVMGIPVRLRQLLVSVGDVSAVALALTGPSAAREASVTPSDPLRLTKLTQAMPLRS